MHLNYSLQLNANQKTSSEKISYFCWWCRHNYNEFYVLNSLLKSLAAVEREKLKLRKIYYKNGMWLQNINPRKI